MKWFKVFFVTALFLGHANAQEVILVSVIDGEMVSIDRKSGKITHMASVNVPAGELTDDLVYSAEEGVFYSYISALSRPRLVKISWDGKYQEIGPLTLNGRPIAQCESLSYNEDGVLYAGISINRYDGKSGSLVKVDPRTGKCTEAGHLSMAYEYGDMDNLFFNNGTLYFDDNRSNNDYLIFKSEIVPAANGDLKPVRIFRSPYHSATDLTRVDEEVYFVDADRKLYSYRIGDWRPQFIGTTHRISDFSGKIFNGIAAVKLKYALKAPGSGVREYYTAYGQ